MVGVSRKVRYLLYVRRCELARVSSDKRANPFAGGQTWKYDSSCGGVSCVYVAGAVYLLWIGRVVCLLLIGLAPFGIYEKVLRHKVKQRIFHSCVSLDKTLSINLEY